MPELTPTPAERASLKTLQDVATYVGVRRSDIWDELSTALKVHNLEKVFSRSDQRDIFRVLDSDFSGTIGALGFVAQLLRHVIA